MPRLRDMLPGDRGGNTALVFALLAPVLVLMGGGAVDYVNASQRYSELQSAADAAAVAAIARYSPGYAAANKLPAGGPVPDATTSSSLSAVFKANALHSETASATLSGASCGGSTFVCRQGTKVYAALTATTKFKPSFLGLASLFPGMAAITTMPLSVKAQATASTPTYVNYFVIVDASQSMGIASTPADMSALYNRVSAYNNGSGKESGCVFGCHVQAEYAYKPGFGFNPNFIQPFTNEDLAHNSVFGAPITLRIDSAKVAIKSIIAQAKQAAAGYANIRFALYTMSHDPTTNSYYKSVAGLSSDYDSLTSAVDTIDLGGNNQHGFGDTDYNDELSGFFPAEFTANGVLANGDGATQATAENYIFIVTDGLSDDSSGSVNNHPTKAFDAGLCTPMKKLSTVGVIYTTYIPIYNGNNPNAGFESNYAALAAPYSNAIPTNLKSCTSDASQYYFEASDGPTLVQRMQQLFTATQKTARLSQ